MSNSIFDSFLALAEEGTWGTATAPTRAIEVVSESLAGAYMRVESQALRAGTRIGRTDRFVPYAKGAAGTVKTEVVDAGFGVLLKHMLGSVATTGAADPYTHTATIGSLKGLGLTMQVGRVANDGTLSPWTYEGGKVASWELSNSVDGVLALSLDMDFKKETIGVGTGAYALATPTYPTSAALLTFVGGVVQIGGVDFAVTDVSLKGNNGLKSDRFFVGATKKEPLEDAMRDYSFELKGEYESLTHSQAIAANVASGTLATVTLNWASPTTGHSLDVTVTNARFDSGPVNFDGPKTVAQDLQGKILTDGTNCISIAYATADATP